MRVFSSTGIHGISLGRASEVSLRKGVFLFLGRYEGRLSPGRTDPPASRPARPNPAPPSRRVPPRSDPPVVCPGFGLDKCSANGLHGNSLACSSEAAFRTVVFDALEALGGQRGGCLLGEPSRQRAQPRSAPPPRRAPASPQPARGISGVWLRHVCFLQSPT